MVDVRPGILVRSAADFKTREYVGQPCSSSKLTICRSCDTIAVCLGGMFSQLDLSRKCPSLTPYCNQNEDGSATCGSSPDDQCRTQGSSEMEFSCTGTGFFPDPLTCENYYYCEREGAIADQYQCPKEYRYNSRSTMCQRFLLKRCQTVKCDSSSQKVFSPYPQDNSFYVYCQFDYTKPNPTLIKTFIISCGKGSQFNYQRQICEFQCRKVGMFVNTANPRQYFLCSRIGFRWEAKILTCREGYLFDESLRRCNRDPYASTSTVTLSTTTESITTSPLSTTSGTSITSTSSISTSPITVESTTIDYSTTPKLTTTASPTTIETSTVELSTPYTTSTTVETTTVAPTTTPATTTKYPTTTSGISTTKSQPISSSTMESTSTFSSTASTTVQGTTASIPTTKVDPTSTTQLQTTKAASTAESSTTREISTTKSQTTVETCTTTQTTIPVTTTEVTTTKIASSTIAQISTTEPIISTVEPTTTLKTTSIASPSSETTTSSSTLAPDTSTIMSTGIIKRTTATTSSTSTTI
ncbi:AAEL012653-PA [Aedes aegypti]|nr:AAEL012653-PA [Aedes aegypti]